jgi:peptidoglycan/LPS O-acetylase OafA/YrhL
MAAHLVGFRPDLASWGVWVFYALSGYLAELALSTKYTGRRFFVGRLHRIFPTFWISAFLTLLVFSIWGNPETFPLVRWPMPTEWLLLDIQSWWGGFFGPRLMPQAWALTVMLF